MSKLTDEARAERLRAAINARPISILDISSIPGYPQHASLGDHWYYCRLHTRAEHSDWAMDGCVRVGPFMTEREARLLSGVAEASAGPLGMEVET